jgi:hypothetical protein
MRLQLGRIAPDGPVPRGTARNGWASARNLGGMTSRRTSGARHRLGGQLTRCEVTRYGQCADPKRQKRMNVTRRKSRKKTYLAQLIPLNTNKIPHLIKVIMRELAAAVQLGAELAADLHDVLEHLVVVLARKQDLARVQLVQGAPDGPHVDGVVEGNAQDDLRGAVEATDEVRHGLVRRGGRVRPVDGRAQIADLENVAGFVDLEEKVSYL